MKELRDFTLKALFVENTLAKLFAPRRARETGQKRALERRRSEAHLFRLKTENAEFVLSTENKLLQENSEKSPKPIEKAQNQTRPYERYW